MKVKRFYSFLCLTILWMILIFMFSAKDADHSHQDSLGVGKMIGRILYSDFENWSDTDQELFVSKIEYPIRKCAHASEYAVLGVLLFNTLRYYGVLRYLFMLAWTGATLYACTDEFHQLFVQGRSGQVMDVMIDSMGALFGIVVIKLILKIFNFVNCRNNI